MRLISQVLLIVAAISLSSITSCAEEGNWTLLPGRPQLVIDMLPAKTGIRRLPI